MIGYQEINCLPPASALAKVGVAGSHPVAEFDPSSRGEAGRKKHAGESHGKLTTPVRVAMFGGDAAP